jgi:hypothetical protein
MRGFAVLFITAFTLPAQTIDIESLTPPGTAIKSGLRILVFVSFQSHCVQHSIREWRASVGECRGTDTGGDGNESRPSSVFGPL